MPLSQLSPFLPTGALPWLNQWSKPYSLYLKITKDRKTKLGDYRAIAGRKHQITINSGLDPELFFFVFTHELAHLIAFNKFGRAIAPHGWEWKRTFAILLLESIEVYSVDLQRLLIEFSKNPKANFMASPELVRYFRPKPILEHELYIEDLKPTEGFEFQGREYILNKKLKKNYLCEELGSGKLYRFSPLAKVKKTVKK